MIRRWHRLCADERGTSLTEFAICLPLFLLVMAFVYHLGAAGHVLSEESARAHSQLWSDVAPRTDTSSPFDPVGSVETNSHPSTAAAEEVEFLEEYSSEQPDRQLATEIELHDRSVADHLDRGGHWGESYRRVQPVSDRAVQVDDRLGATDRPEDVLGGSDYAADLVDDSQSGGAETGRSMAPSLAGGMRYGATHSVRDAQVSFTENWTVDIEYTRDVLVGPRPNPSELRSIMETRGRLQGYDPYRELPGIQMNQHFQAVDAPDRPVWPED